MFGLVYVDFNDENLFDLILLCHLVVDLIKKFTF